MIDELAYENEAKGLLVLMADGDRRAFKKVYDKYAKIVFSAAMTYVRDADLAEEVTQEVFVKVWVKRERFQRLEDPENYFFTIARNTVYSHFRKLAIERKTIRTLRAILPETQDDSSWKLESGELTEIIRSAVLRLPPRQQQIYQLASESGLSNDQIAESLHLSRATVKKHLELARRSVRTSVSERLQPNYLVPALIFISLFH